MSGREAPDFTLNHIEGHPVHLESFRGSNVVIVFVSKDSAKQGERVAATLRQRFDHVELPILLVIDLGSLPRVLQRVAKPLLNKGYQDGVKSAKADYEARGRPFPADASEAVVMLPDLDGSVTASFGVQNANRAATAVLVDRDGNVAGRASGGGAGDDLLTLVE